MIREDFLYQYLLKYNEYEKNFGSKDAVTFWKDNDKTKGTSGLFFMVLRNALVHNTFQTITALEKISSLADVIESLKKCKLQNKDKIKYMNIFFSNKKIKSDLKDKKYKLINTHNREDIFKLFQRKDEKLYSSIFFSHKNLLFDTSISTYNHEKNCQEYYNGYYIETELYEDKYIFKFYKNDESVIRHNVNIYVDRSFNPKRLYQSIDYIDISIITSGFKDNTNIKLSYNDIEKLSNNEIKDLFDTYACDSTIREVSKKIKIAYNLQNNFLHIIGIQNDV